MTQQTPWAILLCKWNDMLTEAKPRSFFEKLFTASGRGSRNMVDFFEDMSHGSVDVGGSQVFGWLTLPKQRSDYKGSGANPQGRMDLINWAKQAATAAGINLSPFLNVVICMNATPTVGTDLFGGGAGVVCDTNVLHGSILGQEMGHGYGLDHSRRDGTTADYTDPWDVMSTWDGCWMAPHNDYALIGPGLNAANMRGRGWLDETRVWALRWPAMNQLVELRPLHRRDLAGHLAAELPAPGGQGRTLLIEFRVREGWDAAMPRSAVLIHRFEGNRSYLMQGQSGRSDLVDGDIFDYGSEKFPYHPYGRVEVVQIDDSSRTATLRLSYRLASALLGDCHPLGRPPELPYKVALVLPDRIVPISPWDRVVSVLEQLAVYTSVDSVTDPIARDAVRRSALVEISRYVESSMQDLDSLSTFKTPKLPSDEFERRDLAIGLKEWIASVRNQSVDVGRSAAADRRSKSKTVARPGYGDQGDQAKRAAKKSTAKKTAKKK
jgi:hypothetical protein